MSNSESTKYWKGLEELQRAEDFEKHRHNEFAEKLPLDDVISENDMNLSSNRRDFLKFMGFGISAATLAACQKTPVKNAIPWVEKPVELDPGIANYYASTCFATSEAIGVLVKTREGRPIKIEGNPDSPLTGGGTSAIAQASVLDLYDNSRLKGPYKGTSQSSYTSIDAELKSKLKSAASKGKVVVLSNTVTSPSTHKVINGFLGQYDNSEHVMYDAFSQSAQLKANETVYGKRVLPNYRLEKAKLIVGFNADFLGTWMAPVEFTKKYAGIRKVDELKDMAMHIQFESTLSLTGSNADLRVPMKPSQEGAVLINSHNEIAKSTGASALPAEKMELAGNSIKLTAKQLLKNKGKAVVMSGTNDLDIQLIVNKINDLLGNTGKTVDFSNPSMQKMGNDESMNQLISDMKSGKVSALIVNGANPVFNHPQGKEIEKAFEKVDLTVSLNAKLDETGKLCTYKCPDHHYLETWNDSQAKANYISLAQPTIYPIFDTRAAQDSFLSWSGQNMRYNEFLKKEWESNHYPKAKNASINFVSFWTKSLHDGFAELNTESLMANEAENNENSENSEAPTQPVSPDYFASASRLNKLMKSASGVELVVYQKVGIMDGTYANNPWLQELPDPVSKVTWDNYVCVSPKMASEQGWKDETVIKVSNGSYEIQLPVLTQPGQPYGTIAIAAGYGHNHGKEGGKVAHLLGQNAVPFMSNSSGHLVNFTDQVKLEATGENYALAKTQTHHHIEGRELVRESSLSKYVDNPKSVEKHGHQLISLYKDYNYGKGHHWAMAIDLNACTGCGACVISCQAENNVPVVGKDEVRRRREMHWIRIDRYYAVPDNEGEYLTDYREIDKLDDLSKFDHIQVSFQPVMCQHCDNAPCENVCPVAAIAHSDEGINQQVYNRCVGTRYCANNCPFKVRRFNWFHYPENDNFDFNMNDDLGKMVLNPDVTVRSRGVMEKCSFCVQRIQTQKLEAKKAGKALEDGKIKTACQQACPADAIVFGDMNDKDSGVYKAIS